MAINLTSQFKSIVFQNQDKILKTNDYSENVLRNYNKVFIDKKNEFTSHSVEIISNISSLNDFVQSIGHDYANIGQARISSRNLIDDEESELIDNNIERIVEQIVASIKTLHLKAESLSASKQTQQHNIVVCEIIEGYLKKTCEKFNLIKSERVKNSVKINELTKRKFGSGSFISNVKSNLIQENSKIYQEFKKSSPTFNIIDDDNDSCDDLNKIEENEIFEKENQLLLNKLVTSCTDVAHIKSQVNDIIRLQNFLSENLTTQQESIEQISGCTSITGANITHANQNILSAIHKKASNRAWILFIMLVLTFALLFIDWYKI